MFLKRIFRRGQTVEPVTPPPLEDWPDYDLAQHFAPRIRFDAHEPFLPEATGYTVFRQDTVSPSFPRRITLPQGAVLAIEYAIWWDWDIQHLYELEHIWVYIDAAGTVIQAEGSWHGDYHRMEAADGSVPLEHGRVTLYAEPGKHALAPSPRWLVQRTPTTRRDCALMPGIMGVHVTPLFEQRLRRRRNPFTNWLVRQYLRQHAFQPSYDFVVAVELTDLVMAPWEQLAEWIPERVAWWTRRLYGQVLLKQHHVEHLFPALWQEWQDVILHRADPRAIGHTEQELIRYRWARLRGQFWRVASSAVAFYIAAQRWRWLTGQRLLDGLHRAGLHHGSRIAAFRSDVLAELQARSSLQFWAGPPPLPAPIRATRQENPVR